MWRKSVRPGADKLVLSEELHLQTPATHVNVVDFGESGWSELSNNY
jgi:hypothetical protein